MKAIESYAGSLGKVIVVCLTMLALMTVLVACGPDGVGTENNAAESTNDGGSSSQVDASSKQEPVVPEPSGATDTSTSGPEGGQPELTPEPSKPRAQLPMRGVTLSAPRDGRIWATSSVETATQELKGLGVNWITYHPYAWIRNDGSLIFQNSTTQAIVANPIRVGKKLNVKVMLKPHIGYWGSKFGWRGDIQFGDDEAAWARFFENYTRWIVVQAKIAEEEKAEVLSIGLEYKQTLERKEWLDVIAAVRKVYSGKLTYAANWDVYKKVPFWDKLDYIGVQFYFPISDVVPPKESDLVAGWKKVLAELKAYSEKIGRPMILTELGYNRSAWAAQKPWDYEQGGPQADETKLLCMKVALEQLKAASFIEGAFLWKWYPDGRNLSHDFHIQYPEMKDVLKGAWFTP